MFLHEQNNRCLMGGVIEIGSKNIRSKSIDYDGWMDE